MNFIHYIKLGAVLLIAVLGFDNYRLNKKVDNLDNALARASVNLHYYESALSGMDKQNKVLQLTVDDFKHSEDSLVQELRKQSKELKIKDKKLKEVASVETIISDTITQEIPVDRNFTVELKPNQLTTIKIERIDSMITHVLDIKNRQDLFIYEEKVWRKKGFFRRLFTLNFKKDIIPHYQIVNSNPLIQVTDTRVIKISK